MLYSLFISACSMKRGLGGGGDILRYSSTSDYVLTIIFCSRPNSAGVTGARAESNPLRATYAIQELPIKK